MLYCHILLLKLIFYVEVLCFYAGALSKNSHRRFDLKLAAKAYKTLWITYKHLSNAFSLGVLFTTLAQFLSSIFCCYHIVLGEKIDSRTFGIHLTLLIIFSIAVRAATKVRTFESCLLRAGHEIASNMKLRTSQRESFRLQLMHQKLSFSVKKLYSFDSKHITKVSFLSFFFLKKTRFECVAPYSKVLSTFSDGCHNMSVHDNHAAVSLFLWYPLRLLK